MIMLTASIQYRNVTDRQRDGQNCYINITHYLKSTTITIPQLAFLQNYVCGYGLVTCIWRNNVSNAGKFLTRKLCSWLSQCRTYRCYCNWLIHLHRDHSYERPSRCVDIRLLTSRRLYNRRHQARLVHCRCRIDGRYIHRSCFTYQNVRSDQDISP